MRCESGTWTCSFHVPGESPGKPENGAEYYSENIGDLWKAVRRELTGEAYCGLGRVISKWGSELLCHGSVLKGPWRGKGSLAALLIYEVGSRVEHNMEVCLGVSAISKDE